MTVICMEEEKDRLVKAIAKSIFCPFVGHCTDGGDCEKCAPKKIDWQVVSND